MFDIFSFLASKHRQPPEYTPQEDDDEEGQLRTARFVRTQFNSLQLNLFIPVGRFGLQ